MSVLSSLLATAAARPVYLATDARIISSAGSTHPTASMALMLRFDGWFALFMSMLPAMSSEADLGSDSGAGAIMAGAGIAFLALNFIPARSLTLKPLDHACVFQILFAVLAPVFPATAHAHGSNAAAPPPLQAFHYPGELASVTENGSCFVLPRRQVDATSRA
jgi:hypothetical protein